MVSLKNTDFIFSPIILLITSLYYVTSSNILYCVGEKEELRGINGKLPPWTCSDTRMQAVPLTKCSIGAFFLSLVSSDLLSVLLFKKWDLSSSFDFTLIKMLLCGLFCYFGVIVVFMGITGLGEHFFVVLTNSILGRDISGQWIHFVCFFCLFVL